VPSLTIENYVKTIYGLCQQPEGPAAATGQIAEALAVSPGTVTSMLKTLKDSGLAQYTPYEGVRLTESGRALALRVIRRHRLIELFLSRTLQLTWDEVHEEAENMEHAVSDLLIDRIDEFLGRPETDPHGDPIPGADGEMRSGPGRLLSEWPLATPFQLVRVLDQSAEFLRYLSEAGLSLGAVGSVHASHAAAGVVTISVAGNETTLARQAAEQLVVSEPAKE
jgi:DtxR family Mn-dependent transcriptional regulator